jgi:3-oxoacyl-[acyl-carrier protein] reductase
MQLRFEDRVAVVTGAAQGIGRAIARAFRDAGATVVVCDRDATGLATTAAELEISSHVLDLSDRSAVAEAMERIEQTCASIDILVNATGGVCGQVGRPLEEIGEEQWRAIFAANVDSAFWVAQAVAPGMISRGRGRIITISSGAGLRPSLTGIHAYTAAKHALVGLTKQLSCELAEHGVTVNSVAPGLVLSNPSTRRQWEGYSAEQRARIIDSIHSKRLGSPEDIAAAVLFLASDAAGWITGQVLSVDGGRS